MSTKKRKITLFPEAGQRWKMLLRIPLGVFTGIIFLGALISAGTFWVTNMPGVSWSGPVPALTVAQETSRTRLERDVKHLAETIGERHTEKAGSLDLTADFLQKEMESAGYKVLREEYKLYGQTVANLIVEVPGTSLPDEIVLVGAHYDSVANCPGADDNGSGTAAVLELARLFADQPQARTIRFVFFVNEEPPWFQFEEMGSLVYARRARKRGDDIVAMYSLEAMGHFTDQPRTQSYPHPILSRVYPDHGNFLAFVGMLESRDLIRRSVDTFRTHGTLPSEGMAGPSFVPGVDFSDHWSFAEVGYPAMMVTDTAFMRNEHYHQPTDSADTLNYPHLTLAVHGLVHVIKEEATRHRPPR